MAFDSGVCALHEYWYLCEQILCFEKSRATSVQFLIFLFIDRTLAAAIALEADRDRRWANVIIAALPHA